MRQVWKYSIDLGLFTNVAQFEMPKDAKIVHVHAQKGNLLCFWAEVDSSRPSVKRNFVVWGTGHYIEDPHLIYRGTAHFQDGALVLHLFEGING